MSTSPTSVCLTRALLSVALLIPVSCSSGKTEGTWWQPSSSPSTTMPAITAFSFEPPVLEGGAAARATVSFGSQIPAGGATLSLRADDGVLAVPAVVTLAAGATTATFSVASQAPAADTRVGVTATLGDQSVSTALPVWVPGVNALWAVRQDGAAVLGIERYAPPEWDLQAYCSNTSISVSALRGFAFGGFLRVTAPTGTPLRTGTFQSDSSFNGPNLSIPGPTIACAPGRPVTNFTITELEYVTGSGRVPRLSLTFTQTCATSNEVVRGGVRLVDPTGLGPSSAPVTCVK